MAQTPSDASSGQKGNSPNPPTGFALLKTLRSIPPEFMLSHHPVCEPYKNHTFTLFGKRLCIGCFIGYPSAITAVTVATILLQKNDSYSKAVFFSGIIGILFTLLSFTSLTSHKPLKIIQKAAVGGGSGLLLTYIFYYPGFPVYIRLLNTVFLAFSLFMAMNIMHIRTHRKICEQCPYEPGFGKCPGYPLEAEKND